MTSYTVFDIRTGEVHGRHLSPERAVGLMLDVGIDHDAEAEMRRDDPGSDLHVLLVQPRPHLAGLNDARYNAIAETAARIGWKAAVEQHQVHVAS